MKFTAEVKTDTGEWIDMPKQEDVKEVQGE